MQHKALSYDIPYDTLDAKRKNMWTNTQDGKFKSIKFLPNNMLNSSKLERTFLTPF
jgi:hypothetical protein